MCLQSWETLKCTSIHPDGGAAACGGAGGMARVAKKGASGVRAGTGRGVCAGSGGWSR
jgi:hypothetical protein